MATETFQQPVLVPVEKPVSLIPVGLKEAALDSPTFRATAVHYAEQVEIIERWLEGYVSSASRLAQEVTVLEGVVNSFLTSANPPDHLSEAVIDHDYTLLAIRRYGEGARDFWSHAIGGFKKTQYSIIDPIKSTLRAEIRSFKEIHRQLELTQKNYDTLAARYFGQIKTKEASSLREDAFQLHEARKSYLRVSMEFCVIAPQLRSVLDSLLIKVFSDQWLEMKDLRETTTAIFSSHGSEVLRIRAWGQDMKESDKTLKRELLAARKDIEESAEIAARPSRELDDYTVSTPMLGPHSPLPRPRTLSNNSISIGTKQGWLYMRTQSGKAARTYWTRRWFFVKNGICGWLAQGTRSGGVEESERVGVLLCSVRVATQEERRFCFEVKTKDATIILQAETHGEMQTWLTVFELAKKKALEQPLLLDSSISNGNHNSDAAFAVSPAAAPELAARRADGQISSINDEPSARVLSAEEISVNRASFEVTSLRKTALEKDGTGRLAVPTSSASGTASSSPLLSPSKGGLASLIQASHSALLSGAGRPRSFVGDDRSWNISADRSHSLAPTTLANAPNPTNLSKTAVMVAMERGLDLGLVDSSGGMPSSLMANQWGTANYGYLSRLERGETSRQPKPVTQPNLESIENIQSEVVEPLSLVESEPNNVFVVSPGPPGTVKHARRMTTGEAEASSAEKRILNMTSEYPDFYPRALKVQDTQLRILFPNLPSNERVVLVFQASWTPDENQEIPGRAYVTTNNLYFYSNHMGFVLVSGIALSSVLDISIASNGQQDVFYLRAKGLNSRSDNRIITVKTFLEPIQRLRNRLNYLVSNASSSNPPPLRMVLQTLIGMESLARDHSPGSDKSWEHISAARSFGPPKNGKRDVRTGLRVDRSLFGGDAAIPNDYDIMKFKLPTQPVSYAPQNMTELAAETTVNVSAKALFHIMFGDKSLVSQMLYFNRRAKVIKQYPWAMLDETHWTRNFEYHVDARDDQGKIENIMIVDSQTVDVANDHLCYVVTDRKSPWHLPQPKDFSLVTKIVITHVAKSTSKLALYTKVEWLVNPGLIRVFIERQGLEDLRIDARSMVNLVSDQVQKLGANCHTKKAMTIFGNIGQSVDANQLTAPEVPIAGKLKTKAITQRNIPMIVAESAAFGSANAAMISLTRIKALLEPFSAHTILLSLLGLSVFIHLLGTTAMAHRWWVDRNAANLMSRLGIGPDSVMSRAVYLSDMYDFTAPADIRVSRNSTNQCAATFHNIYTPSSSNVDVDAGTSFSISSTLSTARRLQRTRQRLGTYRHDLLISLRLINTIERETVYAQYSNWLVDENAKCKQAWNLLESAGERNGTAGKYGEKEEMLKNQIDGVRKWWEKYCVDCGTEMKALGLGS